MNMRNDELETLVVHRECAKDQAVINALLIPAISQCTLINN